ncbi:MAG: cysteine hydrolase [Mycobacteriaceae bacterium]
MNATARSTTAVLALHWQVNVVAPEGFFAALLAAPVAESGVIPRAEQFHRRAREAGALIVWTRFTVPVGEGELVHNTGFMRAVAQSQEAFRPDAPGAQLISSMSTGADDWVEGNQRLSGLAGTDLPDRLRAAGITTLLVTGVATNITVEQTARHATDLGFFTHVVTDCVAASSPEISTWSLANIELATNGNLTSEEALALLG